MQMIVLLAAVAAQIARPVAADPCRPADPAADARPFESLDAYLAARAKRGLTDSPFYKRMKDGRYVCVVWPRAAAVPAVLTRSELERTYGFAARR
jgi:hypothetical protein